MSEMEMQVDEQVEISIENMDEDAMGTVTEEMPLIKPKKKVKLWEKWLLSETMQGKNDSHRIAYIAVFTAFCVVANMFFEFKLAETQFSVTLFLSMLTGIIIGPLFGFVACFLGDLVGFLYHSAGFAYMPWIGLSLGVSSMLAGFLVNGLRSNKAWFLYVKLALVCLLSFTLCTVLINTTAFWLLYSKVSYSKYLVSRLFIQGQIWNCLANYALLFISVPSLTKVKPLKIKIS